VIDNPAERRDLDALLDQLLPFAQEMLRKKGDLFPFGAVMKADGKMKLLAGSAGSWSGDPEQAKELMGIVVDAMRAQAVTGEVRAVGLCFPTVVATDMGEDTEAVGVSLEHVAGDEAHVFLPFTRGRFKSVKFGELMFGTGERRVFTARPAQPDAPAAVSHMAVDTALAPQPDAPTLGGAHAAPLPAPAPVITGAPPAPTPGPAHAAPMPPLPVQTPATASHAYAPTDGAAAYTPAAVPAPQPAPIAQQAAPQPAPMAQQAAPQPAPTAQPWAQAPEPFQATQAPAPPTRLAPLPAQAPTSLSPTQPAMVAQAAPVAPPPGPVAAQPVPAAAAPAPHPQMQGRPYAQATPWAQPPAAVGRPAVAPVGASATGTAPSPEQAPSGPPVAGPTR
jgi:hypothetical protein